jgi:hypothetical protein
MLGPVQRPTRSLLSFRNDLANCPPPETTGPESHGFEKAIVNFLPLPRFEQFRNGRGTHRGIGALKVKIYIDSSLRRDIATLHSIIEKGFPFAHFACDARTAARNVQPSPS